METAMERYYRRKEVLLDALGRECAHCGSTDNIQFDHIDPETKSWDILTEWSKALRLQLEEVKKCQPLCKDCHKIKSDEYQTRSCVDNKFAKRGCDCDLCGDRRIREVRDWQRGKVEYSFRVRGTPYEKKRRPNSTPSSCGEVLHYNRGCRCDDCRRAKTEYCRELRQRRREAAELS